jgi:hypothetical protein
MQTSTSRFEIRLAKERVGSGILEGMTPRLALTDEGLHVLARRNLRHCANDVIAVAERLCRSVGHWSKYYSSQDLDTGVEVRRM